MSDFFIFLDRFSTGVALTLLFAVYFILGGLLAFPYTVASGWSDMFFIYTASSMPIVAVLLYGLYYLGWKTKTLPKKIFWFAFFYILSPIFYNLYSQILENFGFQKSAEVVYRLRFASFIIVPIKALCLYIAFVYLRDWYRKWQKQKIATPVIPITESIDW